MSQLTEQKGKEHKHEWRTIIVRQRAFVDWLSTMPFETRVELQVCECGKDRAHLPDFEKDFVEPRRVERLEAKYFGR